ncbi:FYVE, RhoGEF and PH domain-containing protein 3, partial [Acipenser ruthenus]
CAGCSQALLQIKCRPVASSSPLEIRGYLPHHNSAPCLQKTGTHCVNSTAALKRPPAQKPQVPPKPVHLQTPGPDRRPRAIPPAPSRPLPADPVPKPGKNCTSAWKEDTESPNSVCLLIEKFESSRTPILGVYRRSQLHLSLSMDPAQEPEECSNSEPLGSSDCSTAENLALPVSETMSDDTELSNLSALRIDDISTCNLKTPGDCSAVNGAAGSSELNDNQDSTLEQNGNGKVPNRDSGIDSPSCNVEGEVFSNEEAIDEEEKKDESVAESEADTGTVNEVKESSVSSVEHKRDSTQDEEDSDMDEGSSEEHETAEVPKTEQPDAAKCTEPQKLFNIARELLQTEEAYVKRLHLLDQCTEPQKLFNIARELLQTEEAYVKRLHLLDQVFCTKLTEAGIPQDVITGIFSNITSIDRFHEQFLLPELKTRITEEWNTNPRIGDILQKLAPFLKMYGEYVKNFDRAMDLVNTWTQRSSQFKSVVQNIQKQEVCGNLTLQHHMLEPVQRLPRYVLLLKDYLKKLPQDALDRKDAEKSLELISTAANHSNTAIRKMEKMHKLLEVYERLGGEEDIVNPANELIKEGHIQKLSAKNGTAQDRYLFLFNNMVLYCVPKLRLMGQKFSVRQKIDIAGMQVQENVKQNLTHTFATLLRSAAFIIMSLFMYLFFFSRTEEEKKDWIQVILATIEKHKQNSETFNKAFNSSFSRDEDHPSDSPAICAKCSEFKPMRVCKECFASPLALPSSPGLETTGDQKKKAAVEKQNSLAAENSLLCSSLHFQEKGKTWHKAWVSITKNEPLVLYLLPSSQEVQLPRAIPLPGCEVSLATAKLDMKHVFKLSQSQHSILFSAEEEELQSKWIEILSKAVKGESEQEGLCSKTEAKTSL